MARSMGSVDGNNGGGGLVVTELSHIKELVRQLEVHLGGSHDLCRHLTTQIFTITERSISIITSNDRKRSVADAGLASPLSAAATPTSDLTADGPFRNAKKRKVMEKRSHRVRVGSAGDNPVDDGHSWRKYGQKEILGAKNPRGYYRCTHRHSQGCLATKQVQRTDEDPTLFDIIYHGDHTCVLRSPPAAPAAVGRPEHNPDASSLLQSLTAGLTVKTEGLPALAAPELQGWSAAASAAAAPFYLSSSTPASGCLERSPFSASENNWGVSPATSDSYLPFDDAEWRGRNELHEVVSALVLAGAPAPAPPAVDGLDDLLDMDDIASFFA
ncbi:unnamed protein product [Urochloa decumbens]|uniref:WRKY domain-containing protein n=1 Tax=Urochloa decumbens TaxID=240449 RepID=A0ABC9FI03_9POAL